MSTQWRPPQNPSFLIVTLPFVRLIPQFFAMMFLLTFAESLQKLSVIPLFRTQIFLAVNFPSLDTPPPPLCPLVFQPQGKILWRNDNYCQVPTQPRRGPGKPTKKNNPLSMLCHQRSLTPPSPTAALAVSTEFLHSGSFFLKTLLHRQIFHLHSTCLFFLRCPVNVWRWVYWAPRVAKKIYNDTPVYKEAVTSPFHFSWTTFPPLPPRDPPPHWTKFMPPGPILPYDKSFGGMARSPSLCSFLCLPGAIFFHPMPPMTFQCLFLNLWRLRLAGNLPNRILLPPRGGLLTPPCSCPDFPSTLALQIQSSGPPRRQ